MKVKNVKFLKFISIGLLLIPYLLYIDYVIRGGRGPVDYETFINIGDRFLNGNNVYGENSYYPMPYVLVFALFSWIVQLLFCKLV